MIDKDTKQIVKAVSIIGFLLYVFYRIKNPGGGGTNLITTGDTISGKENVVKFMDYVSKLDTGNFFVFVEDSSGVPFLYPSNQPRQIVYNYRYNDGTSEVLKQTQVVPPGTSIQIDAVVKLEGRNYIMDVPSMLVSTNGKDGTAYVFYEYFIGTDQVA